MIIMCLFFITQCLFKGSIVIAIATATATAIVAIIFLKVHNNLTSYIVMFNLFSYWAFNYFCFFLIATNLFSSFAYLD